MGHYDRWKSLHQTPSLAHATSRMMINHLDRSTSYQHSSTPYLEDPTNEDCYNNNCNLLKTHNADIEAYKNLRRNHQQHFNRYFLKKRINNFGDTEHLHKKPKQ